VCICGGSGAAAAGWTVADAIAVAACAPARSAQMSAALRLVGEAHVRAAARLIGEAQARAAARFVGLIPPAPSSPQR
jgi:hypothetical protein